MTPLETRLLADTEELTQLYEPWRELAHACACPAALPEWQLAWWRHVVPGDARLRTVAVFEDENLVGLAPFYVNPGRRVDYRLLGADLNHRLSPLALPGRENEVARLIAETLAQTRPRPDLVAFEAIDAGSLWPEMIREAWPGRFKPWRYTSSHHPGPILTLADSDFANWLNSRSKRFRGEMRRVRRDVDGVGGKLVPVLDESGARRAIGAFARFHVARWGEGGTAFGPEIIAAIEEATPRLLLGGELRIWTLEIEGDTAAVWIFLTAGGETTAFRTGYDARWSDLRPGQITLLASVEDAFEKGDRRIDLGVGADNYKVRFANGNAPFVWAGLVPRSARYPLTRLRLMPEQASWTARRLAHRLSPEQRKRIKRILRRG